MHCLQFNDVIICSHVKQSPYSTVTYMKIDQLLLSTRRSRPTVQWLTSSRSNMAEWMVCQSTDYCRGSVRSTVLQSPTGWVVFINVTFNHLSVVFLITELCVFMIYQNNCFQIIDRPLLKTISYDGCLFWRLSRKHQTCHSYVCFNRPLTRR